MFKINDYVFIKPTGDEAIDAFLNQQMTITAINRIPYESLDRYRMSYFTQYELTNAHGESITVIDGELEKGERLNGT